MIAALGWSATGIFVRLLGIFSSMVIVAGRCMVGLAALSVQLLFSKSRLSKSHFLSPTAIMLGAIMIGYYVLAVISFELVPVAEAAILLSTTPIFVLAYHKFEGKSIHRTESWGTALSIVGLLLVIAPAPDSLGTSSLQMHLLGDLIATIASGGMAGYAIIYRNLPASNKPASQTVTFWTFLLGSIGTGVWVVASGSVPPHGTFLASRNVLLFLSLGLFSTLLPTICYAYASANLSSIIVTTLRLLAPLLATVWAIVFLAEIPNIIFWPGAVILLSGLLLIIRG